MIRLPAFYVAVQKFGQIPDIDAAETNEDVWDGTGAYLWPAVATAMTISSSSADDDGAPVGSGALTVRVHGLTTAGAEFTQDVTLNGQAGVSIPISMYRVYRAYVMTAGTGGVNAGDIWVGTGAIGVGVPAVKYAGILTGMGQTLMAIYTIPTSLTDNTQIDGGVITRWYGTVGAGQAAFATIALQTREPGGAWRTRRLAGIGEGGFFNEQMDFGLSLPSLTDIRIRVTKNGVNNSNISAGFDMALRQEIS